MAGVKRALLLPVDANSGVTLEQVMLRCEEAVDSGIPMDTPVILWNDPISFAQHFAVQVLPEVERLDAEGLIAESKAASIEDRQRYDAEIARRLARLDEIEGVAG